MNYRLTALVCALAVPGFAQLGDYMGPGVLTHGAGDIGTRGGQQVDLRFFAGATGFYDTGIQPVSVDSSGNLKDIKGEYGVEATIGAYGVHQWRTSQLGLDYKGNFRHYTADSYLDGSDHQLQLGYTLQKSKRVVIDMQAIAGTYSRSIGGFGSFVANTPSLVNDPTLLLFDNRAYFLQAGMDFTYLKSARTIFTAGGEGYVVRRQADSLVGVNGYNLRGSIAHRTSRTTTVGVNYEHIHFDYPKAFGEAEINTYQAFLGQQLGRYWTLSLRGGVYRAEVQGLQEVSLDPYIASLLGVSSVTQTFYRANMLPSGDVTLTRKFKSASAGVYYIRRVTPGNGVFLTSREELAGFTVDYSTPRKFSFSLGGSYSNLNTIGQTLSDYRQLNGGAGLTYRIARAVHATMRYDARHQEIDLAGYRRTGYRLGIGLIFSPGTLPLSLW